MQCKLIVEEEGESKSHTCLNWLNREKGVEKRMSPCFTRDEDRLRSAVTMKGRSRAALGHTGFSDKNLEPP